ncbi:MAG: PKD domain-containing protein [Candidatus Thermoplasmatota archaeon]|nr:PKD domain-containing protein [Candidatus Thermoplasmatota archaeon]
MKARFLAIVIIAFFVIPNSDASDHTSVNVVSQEFASVNEYFCVNISIYPTTSVGGAQCDVLFDSSILEAQNVGNGGMFEEWWNMSLEIDNINGTIKNIVAFNFGGNGTSSPEIFAIITFKAKALGTSYLNLTNVIVSDEYGEAIPFTISNGSVTVANDTIPPSLSYYLNPSLPDGDNGWYINNVEVTLTAYDEHDISDMKYRVDNGNWQGYFSPFNITDNGEHVIAFHAIDSLGISNSTSFTFKIDKTSPSLLHNLAGTEGNNGWYTGNVEVTLTATDSISGVNVTKYRGDSGAWQVYNTPFTLSSNGNYQVDYYSIDNAGNNASGMPFSLKIDKTKPSSSSSLSGTKEGGVYKTSVTVSISRNDATSGIAYTKYRINGGAWTTYSNPFTLTQDDTYTVDYYSVDNAGNTETTKTTTFEILKNRPPVASFTYTPLNPIEGQTIFFDASSSYDPDGSIASYSWNFGDGSGSGKNVQHSYPAGGSYTVTLTVTDNDGATTYVQKNLKVGTEKKLPVANFSYMPLHPTVSSILQFTDLSYDTDGTITNYIWDFGDGNISYEKNPTHTYNKDGTYIVALAVTDDDGATGNISKTIEILPSLPDLILEDVKSSISKNGNAKVTVTIKNGGSEDARSFSCTLTVDGELYNPEFIDSLRPGGEINVFFYPTLSKGAHLLNTSVDPGDIVEESNESNNYKTYSIFVSSPSPWKIDWKVAALIGILVIGLVAVLLSNKKKKIQGTEKDNKKVLVEPEEEVNRCFVCLGKIKQSSSFTKCDCGAVFHKTCAERIEKCPNCGKELREKTT